MDSVITGVLEVSDFSKRKSVPVTYFILHYIRKPRTRDVFPCDKWGYDWYFGFYKTKESNECERSCYLIIRVIPSKTLYRFDYHTPMSDNTVVEEQLKEDSNKDIDDKKKRKKSLKSTDGKSAKSSSRKSSTVPNVENGESIATEDEVPEESKTDSTKEETADTSPQTNGTSEGNHEVSEVVTKDRTPLSNNSNEVTESPDCRPDVQKSQDKNVTMLREMDFRKLAELKEAFHLFDINRDGYIGKQDLRFTFTSMGKPNVTDEALDQMLSEMSGSAVDFDSFVKQFGYKAVQMDPEEELLAALSKWDYLGNGMISEERLKRDLQVWGDKFSEIEAECALEEAPVYKKDGATMIDYIKFCQNICGLRNVEKTRQIEKEAEAYDQELRSFVK